MSEQTANEILKRLDRIEKLLSGNGDPSKGLVVRTDRNEQSVKWMVRLFFAWGLGVVMTVAVVFARPVDHGSQPHKSQTLQTVALPEAARP